MNINKSLLFFTIICFASSVSAQQVLTQQEAVNLALDNNYGVKIANNNLQVADNNTSILNSGYLPTLSANAGATYNLDNNESEFSNGTATVLNGAESDRYNASVSLNYTIFDGLGRRYNYKSLKEQYQLSELQARETIENTITQLFSIYYSVAQLTENLEALNQTLDISKDRLLRADYQFEYGQNSKLGVLNAEVDINNDTINIISANQELKNAKRDLNVVLGNALKEEFTVDTKVDFSLQFLKDSLFAQAQTRNVALLQTEKNIAISQLSIKSNQSGYLPTLGLSGTYGWNKNNNNAASFVAVSTNTGFSAGLNLSWNIFDGGSTKTMVKNARVDLETQQLQKENIVIGITRDFENAWENYTNKLNIYNIQEQNIVTSQSNFERTKEQFKIGQVNSIEFRQAQLNLLNSELSRNNAKYDAKLAELQLLQLSGQLLNVDF